MKTNKGLASMGLLTAISASLCCITPVLALVAGTSGLASTFSWLDPMRPYFIGMTGLVLAFAWYQQLKPKGEMDCECDAEEKTPFMQTKRFLGIVTVLAAVLISFPFYADTFYPQRESTTVVTESSALVTTEFKITGMTCEGCEGHVHHELQNLTGITKSTVSYKEGNAIVEYDESQINRDDIEEAIKATGYEVAIKAEQP